MRLNGSRECREEIHEAADDLGRHDRRDAARRCRIAGAVGPNSESAPVVAELMKSKPKTPAGGAVTVKLTN